MVLRSDYWGQGARSALPMVGEFMQQAIRAKVIDGQERFFDEFDTTPPPPPADSSLGVMRDWIRGLFGSDTAPPAPVPSAPAAWPLGPAVPRPPGGQGLPPVTTDPGYPPAPAEERVGG